MCVVVWTGAWEVGDAIEVSGEQGWLIREVTMGGCSLGMQPSVDRLRLDVLVPGKLVLDSIYNG